MINLRKIREERKKTQQEYANLVNISKKSYERYENEIRPIPSDIIIKFCKKLNVSADYLLGLKTEEEKEK